MNETRRLRRDFFQNILITLLSVSAVLLFMRTQFFTLGDSSLPLGFLTAPAADSQYNDPIQAAEFSLPVRIAASGNYGRYGNVTMVSHSPEFEPLAHLLGDALGTAQGYTACSQYVFLSALKHTSVYYDFLSPLPLSVLSLLTNLDLPDAQFARHIVIAAEDGGVFLYLWDHENQFLRAATAISLQDLEHAVSLYELGNAQFAMDLPSNDTRNIAPCSLLLTTTPVLPRLTASVPALDTSRLLRSLQFNPNTKFRYTDSSGTEVIEESGCTLRIHANGMIHYQGDSENGVFLTNSGAQPTAAEAAIGANTLLKTLLGPSGGEAALYLRGIRESGDETTLSFGYQVNGIPLYFSDGTDAATVTLSGSAVTDVTLRVRQYLSSGEDSLLLPAQQAAAIAQRHSGAELSIGYADRGQEAVSASWLAN